MSKLEWKIGCNKCQRFMQVKVEGGIFESIKSPEKLDMDWVCICEKEK